MTTRDREHDKWIPWYVEDTEGWLDLSLAARGAAEGIARKMNANGELFLRRGLPALATKLGRPWAECEPAIGELVAKGRVIWDGSRCLLVDPEYHERKRKGSAERMAKLRAKRNGDAGDVTPVTSVTPVTCVTVTPVLVSSSLLSSGSDLGSDARPVDGPPEWWQTALDIVEMATGEKLPADEAWLRYDGHRDGKGIAPKQKDAQYWLTTVMVSERRKARDDAHHREQRDKDFDRRRQQSKDPPPPTPASREQAREDAKRFAAAILGRKVGT